jgi:hypothetical protein
VGAHLIPLGLVCIGEYYSVFQLNTRNGEDLLSFSNYDHCMDRNTPQYSLIQIRLGRADDPLLARSMYGFYVARSQM